MAIKKCINVIGFSYRVVHNAPDKPCIHSLVIQPQIYWQEVVTIAAYSFNQRMSKTSMQLNTSNSQIPTSSFHLQFGDLKIKRKTKKIGTENCKSDDK